MEAASVFPGDDVIPDAVMIYDQTVKVHATAKETFPWLQQLGKGRGGWYLRAYVERWLPGSWRASRIIEDKWQHLKPGDRLDEYGFDTNDHFIVKSIDPHNSIVLRSERYGCEFTWALLLHESKMQPIDQPITTVHLRFRGSIQAVGWKRYFIVHGGAFIDYISTAPMLALLKERIEQDRAKRQSYWSPSESCH